MLKITREDNMALMAKYPDKHFDLAIVDPPYFKGVGKLRYMGSSTSNIGVKRGDYNIPNWDHNIPSQKYFTELYRVSKHQIIWGVNYYAAHIPSVGRIVWDKCAHHSSYSDAEIASCSLHDSVRVFRYLWDGMRQATSLNHPERQRGNKKTNEKRIHPTQKPIDLYVWLLQKYAKPGYKILDTHLGSGSIAIACHNLNYDLTACELDTDYYASTMNRIKLHTNSHHKAQETLKTTGQIDLFL